MKYVILQGDGMPDHKLPELGNKTPLEAASTPNLDYIAKRACLFGMVKTIPDSLPPGSDVGNLTVLGYDPMKYYTGRSPLEAASIGVALMPTAPDYSVRGRRASDNSCRSKFVSKILELTIVRPNIPHRYAIILVDDFGRGGLACG